MRAPFPYFGGKSRVAAEVWRRLGSPARYIEPFAGSLAVLLGRPRPFEGREIVNDSDGLLVNTWRALAHDPEAAARWADWPATESDLHARHAWLVARRESMTTRLEGDPDWFDAKAAGWWLWGICLWIGAGWCSGDGSWWVEATEDGRRLLAVADGQGIQRQKLAVADGQGIHRKHLRAGDRKEALLAAFTPLTERLRDVMVMVGDWRRVVTPSVMLGTAKGRTNAEAACAVYLDPPYGDIHGRAAGLYAHDDLTVAQAVREWAVANGNDTRFRIALSGYEGEHIMPSDWTELAWKAKGGYESQRTVGRSLRNSSRERVWFSPHCLRVGLWDDPHGISEADE